MTRSSTKCIFTFYIFAFGNYSDYVKVAELKKTLRVEQVGKECKRTCCGREEGDGREERTTTPLETVRTFLSVVGDRVPDVMFFLKKHKHSLLITHQ